MHSVQIFTAFMKTERALPLRQPHITNPTPIQARAILTARIKRASWYHFTPTAGAGAPFVILRISFNAFFTVNFSNTPAAHTLKSPAKTQGKTCFTNVNISPVTF